MKTKGKNYTSQFKIITKCRSHENFCERKRKPFPELERRVSITYKNLNEHHQIT